MSPTGTATPRSCATPHGAELRRQGTSRRPAEAGLALILVLWVLALLALIAAAFMANTRSEVALVQARIDAAKAEALADGGVDWTIVRLLVMRAQETVTSRSGLQRPLLPLDGSPVEVATDGGAMRISVRDLGGLLELNAAPRELLAGVFQAMGRSTADATALADRLVDFRDRDDESMPAGAEAADYRAAGISPGPRNAPLLRIDELRQIPGFDADFIARLKPLVTVRGMSGSLDPAMADPVLLAGVPGLSATDATRLSRLRDRSSDALSEAVAESAYLAFADGGRFRVTVTGMADEGGVFKREAIVQVEPGGGGYAILDWSQGQVEE